MTPLQGFSNDLFLNDQVVITGAAGGLAAPSQQHLRNAARASCRLIDRKRFRQISQGGSDAIWQTGPP